MPTPVSKKAIAFENNHEAIAVFPAAGAKAEDIVAALDLTSYKAVLLIIGGADSVDEKLKSRLTQVFSRGVARVAATMNAVIIDGGTEAGVMAMMGQGVADRGFKSALVGVAPLGMINYPGSRGTGETPLDPNHSHFVLVEGKAWGSETNVIFNLVRALRTAKTPAVALLAGGGAITKTEALQAVRQNLPLFVVAGSGGTADEIAAASKAKTQLADDPVMAEIIADGRIELHLLDDLVSGAERLFTRVLGGDNVLLQSWGHFADYDLNAGIQQRRFQRLQVAIILIGVLGTALALANQVGKGNESWASWRYWWFYFPRKENTDAVNPPWVGWWLAHYLLLVIPVLLTILITAANRFKQGNKWLLLRAGAEAIKREIYRYRTRAGDYREVPSVTTIASPAATASLASSTTTELKPPPPTPEQVLAQRVEDITRRVMRTEVNASALKPYGTDKGLPPNMDASQGGDDGLSVLTPDRYVQVRLGDQLNYYRTKALKLERQIKVIQWSIFIIGGLGSLLAAISQQVWIALTTALAAALTTYLSYQQTENTLTKYNQAATDLHNVKAWWTALPPEDQAKQDNVTTLVDHTEQVLQSELNGWVQQMQNALAELRKDQEKVPESRDGSTLSQTDAEKAAAAEAAEQQAVAGEAPGDQVGDQGVAPTGEPAFDAESAGEEIVSDETGEATTDERATGNEPETTDEEATDNQSRRPSHR